MIWADKLSGIENETHLEQLIFAHDPEMWKRIYAADVVPEGPGTIIKYPTSEEDFEEMIKEWEGDDYVPEVS